MNDLMKMVLKSFVTYVVFNTEIQKITFAAVVEVKYI